MTQEETTERVRSIAAELADLPKEQVLTESSLAQDLGMDSLTQTEFAMALEEAFGLELSDEEAERITTVGAATEAILAKLTCTSPR